ncbi:hypothetical protein UC8_21810 [Roseimaritima ulvae]|uniref:Uncharacterized protein n=1 Tax=Roseimaritima ulvae TaxID=980254 RepID=A0A5B9QS28_9BACT|nr:hypothetical protein UC8_21810 [Roseimaritima ulvae]
MVTRWRPRIWRSQKDVAATRVHHLVLALGWCGGQLTKGTKVANLRIPAEVWPSNNRPSKPGSRRRPAGESTALVIRHWQAIKQPSRKWAIDRANTDSKIQREPSQKKNHENDERHEGRGMYFSCDSCLSWFEIHQRIDERRQHTTIKLIDRPTTDRKNDRVQRATGEILQADKKTTLRRSVATDGSAVLTRSASYTPTNYPSSTIAASSSNSSVQCSKSE